MPIRKIEATALRLLQEQRVHKPPVPVESIARRLGAEIRYSPFEGDISGGVFRDGKRVIIGINSLHHPNRQRFTIAHEIGHMVLHQGKEIHIDRTFRINFRDDVSSQAVDPEEIEANRFAAELLMPQSMLVRDLKGQKVDIENEEEIRRLATTYGVSVQALSFRLTNLLAWPPA